MRKSMLFSWVLLEAGGSRSVVSQVQVGVSSSSLHLPQGLQQLGSTLSSTCTTREGEVLPLTAQKFLLP
jgi:hypothetical protein